MANKKKQYEAYGESKTLLEWFQDPRNNETNLTAFRSRIYGGADVEQVMNWDKYKSTQHKLLAWGEEKTIREWSKDKRCSITAQGIFRRLLKGATPEEAISLRKVGDPKSVKTHAGWGEHKMLSEWLDDPRCIVGAEHLMNRVVFEGWRVEDAMITPFQQPYRPKALDLAGLRRALGNYPHEMASIMGISGRRYMDLEYYGMERKPIEVAVIKLLEDIKTRSKNKKNGEVYPRIKIRLRNLGLAEYLIWWMTGMEFDAFDFRDDADQDKSLLYLNERDIP